MAEEQGVYPGRKPSLPGVSPVFFLAGLRVHPMLNLSFKISLIAVADFLLDRRERVPHNLL